MTEPALDRFEFAPGSPPPACEVCGGTKTRMITKLHLRSTSATGGLNFEVDESQFECTTCRDETPPPTWNQYLGRVDRLARRGLARQLCDELWEALDPVSLAKVEACSNSELSALNRL